MLQSKLFTKTRKEAPSDEVSKNAQFLIRAGFVHKDMAGVYSYLPLGYRVVDKITAIIRDEMNKLGGQEIALSFLQSSDIWEKTDRWDDGKVDVWFKTKLHGGSELGLAFTNEEHLAHLLKDHISSHKDLPRLVYQIRTKFRNEARAKSGVMRGREFMMKDLYSFTKSEEDTEAFHDKVKPAYMNIYNRLGIGDKTYLTISSGEPFSKYSTEFQTLSEAGEDTIMISKDGKVAVNKEDYNDELIKDFGLEGMEFEEHKAIEVGDIYKLGTRYSEALGLNYKDENGDSKPVNMGSYGIGVSRLVGTIVEVMADEKGMVWPESIAPFKVHLIEIAPEEGKGVRTATEALYEEMQQEGIEVLFDDRELRPGEKFADADLIGIPYRVVVSEKTLEADKYEVKKRDSEESEMLSKTELFDLLKS